MNQKTNIERHIQTILVSLITAAIIFAGVKLSYYQEQFGRIEERLTSLNEKLNDVVLLKSQIQDTQVRLSILETKVNNK